jgi:hypothetical protein
MADDYNISYSYHTGPQGGPIPAPTATARDSGLYAFAICDRIDLDSGSVLLLSRSNGRQITISPEVATALTYCTSFKTLEEHANTLVASIPQLHGQFEDVSRVLIMVRDAGLMYSAQEICAQFRRDGPPKPELAPIRACIITCDRPAALERLLDSMLQAGNLSRNDELFLVDDSRDPDNREQNRELVAKFNLTSPRDMRYVGVDAQRRLVNDLIAKLPQHEDAIRFLVDRDRWTGRKTYGLARNLCLLLSSDYRCVVLDDDTLCRTVAPPLPGEGISFGGGDSRALSCFGSETELMQNAVFQSFDPISGHAQCLGMNLGHAMEALELPEMEPASLSNTNAALITSLHKDSPVLLTQCGSWGDPGTEGSNWWSHLGQDSIARALSAPGGLASAMKNRHYWLGRTRPNVAKMAVMSQATGLDNSQLLPPYFPAFRGEDYLFAGMVVWLHPESAVLDYAWSVPHLPVEKRTDRVSTEGSVAQADLALCARYLSDLANFEAGACAQTRLQGLAAHLRELSEREPASLLATFRKEMASSRAAQLAILQKQMQSAPALGSSAWEDYLQRAIELIRRELESPADPLSIPGVDASADEGALLRSFQRSTAEFSNALAAWPTVREAAERITTQLLENNELAP